MLDVSCLQCGKIIPDYGPDADYRDSGKAEWILIPILLLGTPLMGGLSYFIIRYVAPEADPQASWLGETFYIMGGIAGLMCVAGVVASIALKGALVFHVSSGVSKLLLKTYRRLLRRQ